MKQSIKPGRQLGDLLAYILLPLLTVLLPFRAGDALVRTVARRGWLLQARSRAGLQAAAACVPVGETEDWRARWRLAELADARDAWLCLFGRSGALARHVSRDGPLPAPGTVLVGAHWGTGLRALIVFRRAGLAPRFVYRRVDTSLRRAAPFQYLYLKVLVHCIRRVCAGRSIEVPGARRAFEAALGEAGSLVVLLDAPARNRADAIAAQVVGRAAEFNRNGARLLAENGARCVFYALAEQLRGEAELSCSAPFVPDSAESLVHDYGRFLTGLLEQDAAQWRLWHAAPQVFRESG